MTAKEFWEDFETYEEDLRINLILANKEGLIEPFLHLCVQLRKYCRGIVPKIYGPDVGEDRDIIFIISCGGEKDMIPYVNRLQAEAPKLKQWEIKGLVKGKMQTNPEIISEPFNFDGFSIRPKDIKFAIDAWDKKLGVVDLLLLLPLNLSEIEDDVLEKELIYIIEVLWGECFVAEKINRLYFTHVDTYEKIFFDLELLKVSMDIIDRKEN